MIKYPDVRLGAAAAFGGKLSLPVLLRVVSAYKPEGAAASPGPSGLLPVDVEWTLWVGVRGDIRSVPR